MAPSKTQWHTAAELGVTQEALDKAHNTGIYQRRRQYDLVAKTKTVRYRGK